MSISLAITTPMLYVSSNTSSKSWQARASAVLLFSSAIWRMACRAAELEISPTRMEGSTANAIIQTNTRR